MFKLKMYSVILIIISTLLFSCNKQGKGNLRFAANGEGFVANGFTGKTGWKIAFDKVLVNLSGISVTGKDGKNTVSLNGNYLVDLKSTQNAVVNFALKKSVPAVEYRKIKWSITRIKEGRYKGYSIVMIGRAEKNGKSVNFTIKINEEIAWYCKSGYSGDKIKGIVRKGQTGEVELTFHFDHIFGDKTAEAGSHINKGAVGFDYFIKYLNGNTLDISQEKLASASDKTNYKKFIKALQGLGHSGEAHADVIKSTTNLSSLQ